MSSVRGLRGLGKAISGVFIGILLILITFPLLFWNEGRAIKTAQSLEEGADAVVSIGDPEVDPANDGELIHFTGEAQTSDTVADPKFSVERDAIALRRTVEMYQWHEEEQRERRQRGGETRRVTTYSYHTDWSERAIDSSRFNDSRQHTNPGELPYEQVEEHANDVRIGDFQLTASFIAQLDQYTQISLDEEFVSELPDGLDETAQLDGDYVYIGDNPSSPEVGDVRISFSVVEPHVVSVIGAQEGSTLAGYATEAGRTLDMVSAGRHGADEMFEEAMAENRILTWGLRGMGLILMFIGFSLVFGPVDYVARFIPLVGRVISAAKSMIAAGLTLFFGGTTIAVGWVFYRPLIGVPLLFMAFCFAGTFFVIAYLQFTKSDDDELAGADQGIGTV